MLLIRNVTLHLLPLFRELKQMSCAENGTKISPSVAMHARSEADSAAAVGATECLGRSERWSGATGLLDADDNCD